MLVMVPDNPASGAIYIYDRVGQQFSLVSFEGADDTLTTQDFDGCSRVRPLGVRPANPDSSSFDPATCDA